MKAIRFHGAGGAEVIRLVEVPEPDVRPTDLLVRVHSAGVNRADILQREGYYGQDPDFGDSNLPGLELAGEVVKVGPEAKGYRPGDRVMAVVGGGAYAEFARFDYRMAMPIPDLLDYAHAAAIPEVFVTANEALIHLGEPVPGNWALIHAAAGGVGSAAIQLAHAFGLKTVFTATGAERISQVQAIGGTVPVDYRKQDFLDIVREVTENRGVDVVVDFVGGSYFERNLLSLAPGGRLIQVGVLDGNVATVPFGLIIHNYLRIIGTVMKSRSFEEKLGMTTRFRDRWLDSFATGKLSPVLAQTFPLEQAAAAHNSMEGSGNFGKIVLTID